MRQAVNAECSQGRKDSLAEANLNICWLSCLSAILGYFLQILLSRFHIPQGISAWLVYLIIFGVTLVINLSVIPLPFAISLMVMAAHRWNPILVALSGSLGASLGESSSYLVGYFGTKIAIKKEVMGYKMI